MSVKNKDEIKEIRQLGNQEIKYQDNYAPRVLESFINKHLLIIIL